MDEALDMTEADVKREYVQALELVPHLVETETPKAKFLRTESNDPWKAARRLCLYWKFRKQICTDVDDEERWIRPMNLTGRGFLKSHEVRILRRGMYTYHCSPESGPLLIVNGARNKGATAGSLHRINFYFATVVQEEALQTQGITIVYAVTSGDTHSHISNVMGVYVATGLPIRVRGYVVIQSYEMGKESLLEYLAFKRQAQVTHSYRGKCQVISSNQSRADLMKRVQRNGIPWNILPKSCGGRYEEEILCQWLRQRMTLEDAMSAAPPSIVVPSSFLNNNTSQRRAMVISSCGKRRRYFKNNTNGGGSNNGLASTREPWIDVAYQREFKRLNTANDALRIDNKRLEELLVQARRIVLDHQFNNMAAHNYSNSNSNNNHNINTTSSSNNNHFGTNAVTSAAMTAANARMLSPATTITIASTSTTTNRLPSPTPIHQLQQRNQHEHQRQLQQPPQYQQNHHHHHHHPVVAVATCEEPRYFFNLEVLDEEDNDFHFGIPVADPRYNSTDYEFF